MLKAALRTAAQATVRRVVASSWSRDAMNALYLSLGPAARSRFQREFAKIFRERTVALSAAAEWRVRFAGRILHLPLTTNDLWQEWDSAVSILGNDMEVKRTYETLLSAGEPPDLFVDVGANYGTHSLLFMAAEVPTITFEPNPGCLDYFRRACILNGFSPALENVALGRGLGRVVLSYPPRDTWNGATRLRVEEELAGSVDLVAVEVEQRTLDSYIDRFPASGGMLLKIDTEGNELAILHGADRTLRVCRPVIIFECLETDANRPHVFEFLQLHGYDIATLPLLHGRRAAVLSSAQFLGSSDANFIAIPRR